MNNQIGKNSELSALVSADSFFYTLLTKTKVKSISHSQLSLLSAEMSKLHTSVKISKSKFGVLNHSFTIIPQSEFDPDYLSSFLTNDCLLGDEKELIFRSDISEKYDVRVVYSVEGSLVKMLNEHLNNPSLCHIITALLDGSDYAQSDQPSLEVCLIGDQLIIIAEEDQKLLLANIYHAKDAVSVLYFMTLVINHLNFNPEKINVSLSGTLTVDDEKITMISRYFRSVKLREIELKTNESGEKSQHHYFPFICIAKCV